MEEEKIEKMEHSFSLLTAKNKVKEVSTEDKFYRFAFKVCERWMLSSDSKSDFNTHLEQVKVKNREKDQLK